MIDTILFDLDGTLLNTLDDITDSVNQTLQFFSRPTLSAMEVKERIGDGIKLLISRILPDADDQLIELATKYYRTRYTMNQFNHTKPYEGVVDILKALKNSGKKIAVVTNKNQKAAIELTNKYFGNLIDLTLGDDCVRKLKPDPSLLQDALTSLNSMVQNSIMVGDSEMDALAADNFNISFVGVSWGYRSKQSLASAGAKIIVDNPRDIIDAI